MDVRTAEKMLTMMKDKKRPDISKRMKQQWQDPEYRASMSGDNNPMKRPEQRKRMSENNPTKRPEVRAKMSKAAKKQWQNEDYRASMSGDNNPMKRPEVRAKLKGRKCPWMSGENNPMKRPEVRKKMSIKFKGENNPTKRPEVRAKISIANKGRKRPDVSKRMKENNPMKCAEAKKKMTDKIIQLIVANNGINPGNKHSKQGKFYSHKNQDFIFYDSSYELRFFGKLEDDTSVKQYMRCPYVIDYTFDGGQRKYLPDILVEYTNDKREIIEVKPSGRVFEEQNLTKFAAAREFCKENKMTFAIVTEKELL